MAAEGREAFRGRTYIGIERSTLVIDRTGNVAKILRSVKPERHADQVLEALAV